MSTNEITIENDIELPEVRASWPIAKLQPGQGFKFDVTKIGAVRAAAGVWAARNKDTGAQFRVLKLDNVKGVCKRIA